MTKGYVLVPPHNGRGRQSTSERVVVSNSTTNDRLAQAALSSGKGVTKISPCIRSDQGGRFRERVEGKMYQPSCRERFLEEPKNAMEVSEAS